MTTQTPSTAEIEKWLWIRVQFFSKFWLGFWIWVRKENAESCRSRLRIHPWSPLRSETWL